MSSSSQGKSMGSLGGGIFLCIAVVFGWWISGVIFPKLPDYEETMEQGQVMKGEVLRTEPVDNVTINGRNPVKVFFRYGEEEAEMTMALGERAKKGQALKVRVLNGHAYPEEIEALVRPGWLKYTFIAAFLLGGIMIGFGLLRLLVIGGVLFAAGRSMLKKDDSPPPPPGPDVPPPPPSS